MSSDEQKTASPSVGPTAIRRALTKYLAAVVFALLGAILVIATKTTAGGALLIAAALVLLPVRRLGGRQQIANWLRAGLVCLLIALAIYAIAGTDVVPEQAKTGVKFLDQLSAIWQRFQDNLFGRTPLPTR